MRVTVTEANDATSTIPARQNEPAFQRLLKARQWRWAVAVRWQKAQLALVLTPPAIALLFGSIYPEIKPWIAFFAVGSTLLDVALFDRAYKAALKAGARASEFFDCQLLQLDWNSVVAGKQPSPEETDRAAHGWDQLRKKGPIVDWYSSDVNRVSHGLARVICQRTNLTYDSDLRKLYRTILDISVLLMALTVLGIGLLSTQKFPDFVLSTWVPTAPFFIWALRERFRQADAVQSNDPVITEAEKLISAVIAGSCDDGACKMQSRLLQDAIFYRRANTVLLFPGIYKIRRKNAEREMRAGAAHWVEKAGK
ncbi:hypothetical protein SAMN02799622_06013 [Methylobacterium sp. UNC378MF]|nr:hypothetical protein SAMN02799622_06013 [Methylobacterium sp. UNC378MF]